MATKRKQITVVTPEPVDPSTPVVGNLVTYYLDGWRAGHLEVIKGKVASVRPIGPKGSVLRLVRVPLEEIHNAAK